MNSSRITIFWSLLLCLVSATAAQDSAESFDTKTLQRQIRETSDELDVPDLASIADQDMIAWIENIQYSMDNAYDQRGQYYLALQISLANHSDKARVFLADDITLICGKQTEFHVGDIPDNFSSGPLRVGSKLYARQQLVCPEKITLQPSQGKRFWMLFAGLPQRSQLEKIRLLLVDDQQQTHELNIKRQCSLRLGMSFQRIGPLQAIGLITIQGELNPINVEDVANQIFRASIDGTTRFVVSYPKERFLEEDLANWLLNGGGEGRANPLFRRFPTLPDMRFLGLTGVNEEQQIELEFETRSAGVFASDLNAVRAALGDVCARVSSSELLEQVQRGHPLVRHAILRWNGKFLGQAAWPQLKILAESDDPADLESALIAAGHQLPASEDVLKNSFADHPESVVEGLLQADYAASLGLAQAFLSTPTPDFDLGSKVDLVGKYYRPEWHSLLEKAVADSDPETRMKALRVLAENGHPDLLKLLSRALEDENSDVRDEAFRILAFRSDTKSFEIALQAALRRFSNGDLSNAVLDIARNSRDPRFAIPLRQHLIKNHPLRSKLIELLEQVGDSEAVGIAMSQYEQLRNTERVALLGVLINVPVPGRLELAEKAFQSESVAVLDAGSELLETIGSDEAVDVIEQSLLKVDDETSNEVFARHIRALARIATPTAIQLLKTLRISVYENKDPTRVRLVRAALKYVESLSPAANSYDSATYYMRVKQWADARRHFALANRIDPTFSSGWANMGHISLHESTTEKSQGELSKAKLKIEQAKAEFSKAMSIDPYDGYAVTGLGIALAQLDQPMEGIQLVNEAAERFPFDNVFEYNTACVYGRAIESIMQTKEQNASILKKLKDDGVKHLKSALELGFNDFDLMHDDPDLNSLRDHPEFDDLLKE